VKSASPEQAAAIAAAIEQFVRATAAAGDLGDERPDPWIRRLSSKGSRADPELTFPASG